MAQVSKDWLQRGVSLIALFLSIATAIFVIGRDNFSGKTASQERNGINVSHFAKDGVLKVAVVPAPPITEIEPASKRPQGYAVDVINAIAQKGKLQVNYLPTDWATMGAALSSGKADLAIGPIFVTEGRAKEYAFTDSLFAYAIVAVVPTQNSRINKISDLQKPGLRIAVGRGGFDSEFVGNTMPQAAIDVFPPDDPNLPMLEVVAGRADLALADFATATRFVSEHPEITIGLGQEPISLQYAAFMLRHEDMFLRDFINIALRNLDLSGALSVIDKKYANRRTWYARVTARPALAK
jgi:ABC-type amino acid transport substrate-binding protein